jgi:hypothetical protein
MELTYDAEVLAQGKAIVLATEMYDLVRTRCDAVPFTNFVAIKTVNNQLTSPKNVFEKAKSKQRFEVHSKIIR